MVLEIFCIVLILVIVILFLPSTDNSIDVFSFFIVKLCHSTKQDTS